MWLLLLMITDSGTYVFWIMCMRIGDENYNNVQEN